ncbi:HK97 family phage prohead protease [Virgibacillus halotolerans]|uniref:HK97 family phage prohead protease n=1 Tax=Virgibacillus halotolerans TaxID=1071053 RepID=UPI00196116E4|nr:HK97 family phage prohead protease [Virgibacillus halotolerans]MBM7598476.1 HK97 family phage prohead protease [Virgibacillus halotolerans]
MKEQETRMLDSQIEIRSIGEDDEKKDVIVGYALRFNTYSGVMYHPHIGEFTERIDPTALDNADISQVTALINHDANMVLGRSTSGTLTLEVDEFGLKYTIDPPDTSYARDLMESMKRGDISQSSFAFSLDYEDENAEVIERDVDSDIKIRTIKRFKDISDVSVVTYPAYESADVIVAQRSLDNYQYQEQRKQNQINKQKMLIELEL